MPIRVTCPECGTATTHPDAEAGKKARCPSCLARYEVPAPGITLEAADVEEALPADPREARRPPSRPERPRRSESSQDREEPPPRRSSGVGFIVLAVGLPLLALALACGGTLLYVRYTVNSFWHSVTAPTPAPTDLDEALAWLKSGDRTWVKSAAATLAQVPLDEDRQAEVSRALDPYLTDRDASVRLEALRAIKVWATPENVPALCQSLTLPQAIFLFEPADEHQMVFEVLGRLKDARAAGPLAERLGNFNDRPHAARALVALGAAAVPELNKRLDSSDPLIRDEAKRALKQINPADDVDFRAALLDVKSRDLTRRRSGAEALSRLTPDERTRAEVASALELLLRDADAPTREWAAQALVNWAGKDNVPALIKALGSDSQRTRLAALTALTRLKDARAIPAVAARLRTEPTQAGATLEALGPEAEKEVVPFYFETVPQVRDEARRLLEAYGTREEVILARAAVDVKSSEPVRAQEACRWLARATLEPKAQAEVSKALNVPLTGGNALTRAEAVRALKVWATKDNVPGLIQAVHDFRDDFFAKENTAVRHLAISTLGGLQDARAAEALAERLADDPADRDLPRRNPGDRDVVTRALNASGPVAIQSVNKLLDHRDPAIRSAARRILANLSGGLDEKAVLADLKAEDAARRTAAAEKLPLAPPEGEVRGRVAKALEGLLEDPDLKVRVAAARALAFWATKDNYDALVKAAGQESQAVRHSALLGLGMLKDARSIGLLVKALEEPANRDAAARALQALGQEAEPEVLRALDSKEADTRRVACEVLGSIGTRAGSQARLVKVATKDPDMGVQKAAWAAYYATLRR